ncbi:hypothetical protein [Streptomyces sp. NPDC001568]|uniref:SCO6745 family protein n=1 Tax=Streptomyces sp. NPDC001568 TaxID=3364588 RepID=UPI0036A20EA7
MTSGTQHDGPHAPATVRQLWQLLEPMHALIYFAPESYEEAGGLGYDTGDRWPLYFAFRAAPLGAVAPPLVTSLFYSFAPSMVERYVSQAWRTAPPEQVLAARATAIDRASRSVLGDRIDSPDLAEAARIARRAAEAARTAGRPLAAANAALPWPQTPHGVLWHAATILREHRGDGHLVALQAHHLDAVEALVLQAGVGAAPVEAFEGRGWSAQEWSAARDRLAARGLLAEEGSATEGGLALRTAVERLTEDLASAPWSGLTARETARLAELLLPPVLDVVGTGLLPAQGTLGIGMKYDYAN